MFRVFNCQITTILLTKIEKKSELQNIIHKILFISSFIFTGINLYPVQEMQMEIEGTPYKLFCSNELQEKEKSQLQIFEKKLMVSGENQHNIILQFFKDKIPQIVDNTAKMRVIIRNNDKVLFTNDEELRKQLSEPGSLDEDGQDFQLDGTTLFIEGWNRKEDKREYHIQFDRQLKLFCADEKGEPIEKIDPVVVNSSCWRRSSLVMAGLNQHSRGSEDSSIGLPWEREKIVQMNEYFDMSKEGKEKFIDSLSMIECLQFIIQLQELVLIESDYDDLRNALHLLAEKLNEASLEDIELFLKKTRLSPQNDNELKNELLRIVPELYTSFITQKGLLIDEEQLDAMLVAKCYWRNYGSLYDLQKQEIIKDFKFLKKSPTNDTEKFQLDNKTILIRTIRSSSSDDAVDSNFTFDIELYDLETREVIKKFLKVHFIFILDSQTVAIEYDTNVVELFDFKKKRTIKKFQETNQQPIMDRIRQVNNQVVVIRGDRVELYNFKENRQLKIFEEEALNAFSVNDQVVAILYGAPVSIRDQISNQNKGAELYDFKAQETIEAFKTHQVFRVNNHIVQLYYPKDNVVELYDFVKKEKVAIFQEISGKQRRDSFNDQIIALYYLDNAVEIYDLETKKVIKRFENVFRLFALTDQLIAIKNNDDTVELYHLKTKKIVWKREIGRFAELHLLGEALLAFIIKRDLSNSNDCVKIYNWKKDKLISEENGLGHIFVRGNNIWAQKRNEKKRLRYELTCFGPDFHLKKLTAEQLLLIILAQRSDRHPEEIDKALWDSIGKELQKKLSFRSILVTKMRRYFRNFIAH